MTKKRHILAPVRAMSSGRARDFRGDATSDVIATARCLAMAAVMFAACTRPTPTLPVSVHCVPNAISACLCDGRLQGGIHRCGMDGASYGACDCAVPMVNHPKPSAGAPAEQAAAGSGMDTAASTAAGGAAVAAAAPATAAIARTAGVAPEPMDEATYVFDQSVVRTYNIVVAAADLQMIAAQPSAELSVPAMLEFEGKTLGPFMVRYKGNSWSAPCTTGGRDDPKDGKCSMKLEFHEQDPSARFYGMKKLNFHSMNNDVSMMRDRLGYALFREMGVAAPRSAHARLLVNGKLEGLFLVVEQVDGTFARTRFTDGGKGNLYKEVWPIHSEGSVYLEKLITNEKDQPSVQGMLAFKTAVDTGPDAVQTMIDREYMLRYLAVDRVIINDDGALHFWCDMPGTTARNGNFYWYETPAHDKFWLIAWDLDESFDGYAVGRISPKWSVPATCTCTRNGTLYSMPSACDPLTQTFIAWLTDYDTHVEAFVTGPFAAPAVDAKLATWSQQIAAAVDEAAGNTSSPSATEWRAALTDLDAKIASARQHRGYAY